MQQIKNIAWIGTGIMGAPMAARLLKNGYNLFIHNRTKEKADRLLESGAVWCDNPAEAASKCDAAFTMLSLPEDVEKVILGTNGVLEGIKSGGVIIDMSTSSPLLAEKIYAAAKARNVQTLDAPVTGGDNGAKSGHLSIFAGGSATAFKHVSPCLKILGNAIMYCGAPGSGQLAKLANQVNVAGVTFGTCESLLFAHEAGLNVAKWLELVVNGSSGSKSLDNRGRLILQNDMQPGFIINHFVKDLGLCLAECRRMGLVLPCAELAEEFYRIMQCQGAGQLGTQALIEGLAKLSGKKWLHKNT